MLTSTAYIVAWLVYLLATLAFVLWFNRFTSAWTSRASVYALRGAAIGCLLAPAMTDADRVLFAPAILTAPLALLSRSSEGALASIIVLGVSALVAIVVSMLYYAYKVKVKQ